MAGLQIFNSRGEEVVNLGYDNSRRRLLNILGSFDFTDTKDGDKGEITNPYFDKGKIFYILLPTTRIREYISKNIDINIEGNKINWERFGEFYFDEDLIRLGIRIKIYYGVF